MKKILIYLICVLLLTSCSFEKRGSIELDSVFETEAVEEELLAAEELERSEAAEKKERVTVFETNDDMPVEVSVETGENANNSNESDVSEVAETDNSSKTSSETAKRTVTAVKINAAELAADATVWISASGSKYHNTSGCSNMSNAIQTTKSAAEADGKSPCKKCYQ